MTKNKNDNNIKQTSVVTTISAILIIGIASNILGFLAWASYQVAATQSGLVPTMSLMAGLGFWNTWILLVGAPLAFKVLFQSSVQADVDARHADNLKKIYDTSMKTYAFNPPNYSDIKTNDKLDS